ELAQHRLQSLWIESAEDVAERVVAGDAVFQRQKLPQQLQPTVAEDLELRTGLGAAQRRCQGNDDDFHKIVPNVVGAGILERAKDPPELAHSGLPWGLGDPQRIQFPSRCNAPVGSYAIPLP